MKWMRDTDGNRMMSSIVKHKRALDQTVDQKPMLARVNVGAAGVIALEK